MGGEFGGTFMLDSWLICFFGGGKDLPVVTNSLRCWGTELFANTCSKLKCMSWWRVEN